MTLIGENEETKNIVFRILSELLSILENSSEDIVRFQGLDRRSNCTELTYANGTDNGTKLLRNDDQLCGKRTSFFPYIQRFGKRRNEKQRERHENHSLQRVVMASSHLMMMHLTI